MYMCLFGKSWHIQKYTSAQQQYCLCKELDDPRKSEGQRPFLQFTILYLLNFIVCPCIFFFFFINLFIYLFIHFWLCWVFVAARGLSLAVASRGCSSLWCAGFSLRWLLLLESTGCRHAGSVIVVHGLSSCGARSVERRLSSCGARTQLLRGMWDLPGPGLEPVSPALAGGF